LEFLVAERIKIVINLTKFSASCPRQISLWLKRRIALWAKLKFMTKKTLIQTIIFTLALFVAIGIGNYALSSDSQPGAASGATAAIFPEQINIIFNYKNWPHSTTPKTSSYLPGALGLLGLGYSAGSGGGYSGLVDINGDGLNDIIYSFYMNDYIFRTAVLLNQGNNDFNLVYKCVAETNSGVATYYGDCAQL